MSKFLKVAFPQKCIGCELCVLEIQRQMGKVGLEGSLIRIFKEKNEDSNFLRFAIEIDPRTHKLNVEKVKNICPTLVFEVIEEEQNGLLE